MMFLLDLAFAVELLTISAGICFLIWSFRNEGPGVKLAKITGYFITVLGLLALLCTTCYGTTYWKQGFFKTPHARMQFNRHMMMQRMQQQKP